MSSSDFAVGDDDDEPQNVGRLHEASEEAQQWDKSHRRNPEDFSPDTSTKYGTLDDRDIWDARDGQDS